MFCKPVLAVLLAVPLAFLANQSESVADEVGNTQDTAPVNDLTSKKWDCIHNQTGKPLWVTLATGSNTIRRYVGVGKKLNFRVGGEKIVAMAAFQYGTNELVNLTHFGSVPQKFPPSNCYPILTNIPVNTVERGTEQESAETESPEVVL